MNETLVIDVTKIEPRLKHSTIFNSFDDIKEGEAILIHNDHDPKPLYYQLLGERGNCFSWSYVSSGPDIWEVEIRKNEADEHTETLGEIVKKDLRNAEVFKRLGLDFCCGGKKSLEKACNEKGLDIQQVKAELEKACKVSSALPSHDFNSWSITFLTDYIVNVHHAYVNQNIPILQDLSNKVAEHHGRTHNELWEINNKVEAMINELKVHMKKEEQILFPYFKQLESSKINDQIPPHSFGSVIQPISVMENDHDIVGKLADDIRQLTNDYTLPQNACNSYALLYKKLEDFENDLHLHIHLENNILFPKAIEIEKTLKA